MTRKISYSTARTFAAIAERIRAGEPLADCLRDYGVDLEGLRRCATLLEFMDRLAHRKDLPHWFTELDPARNALSGVLAFLDREDG